MRKLFLTLPFATRKQDGLIEVIKVDVDLQLEQGRLFHRGTDHLLCDPFIIGFVQGLFQLRYKVATRTCREHVHLAGVSVWVEARSGH